MALMLADAPGFKSLRKATEPKNECERGLDSGSGRGKSHLGELRGLILGALRARAALRAFIEPQKPPGSVK